MLTGEERMELDVLAKHGAGIRELAPPMGGARNTRITGSEETWLLALVAAEPDLTIADLRERLRRGRGWSPGMARPEEAGPKPFRREVIRPRHRVAIRLSQPVSDKG